MKRILCFSYIWVFVLLLSRDVICVEDAYDFIVVGGGVGGCTVAGRLAENGKHSVLLIEQGGFPLPDQEVPAQIGRFLGNPETATVYNTIPQINAALDNNGIVQLTVGRGLGGGSAINGMYFNRGNQHDYNYWARITRDYSWNYTNLMPYFKKIETYAGNFPSDEEHGFDGPITISSPDYAPGQSHWLRAGRELGFPNLDPNGPQQFSFTKVEFTKNFGRRVSAYNGYVEPLRKKRNLRILVNTQAIEILFERNKAIGIKYKTNNGTVAGIAHAKNEIIITCGTIGTPLLLQKSGIGPRQVLERANIPVKVNLPVGKYIHDQAAIMVPVILNKSAVFDPTTDLTDEALQFYNQYGDGPYSTSLGTSGQAFLPSSALPRSEKQRNWADIHILAFNMGIAPAALMPQSKLKLGEAYAAWSVVVSRPKSRGSVSLNTSDINGPPLLDFQYFNHPIDMQVAIDGAKWVTKICEETKAFKSLGCRLPGPAPNCLSFKFKTDRYWNCYVKYYGRTALHPAGGCQMGAGWDNLQATVDSKLRVIGVEGLRIADASAIPAVINSNTMPAVYVIAEKLSADLLDEWSHTHVPITPRKAKYLARIKL